MSAMHVPGDDFETDVHLDSAKHGIGATGHGGARRRLLSVGEKCETVVKMKALKYCNVDTFESVDFGQA